MKTLINFAPDFPCFVNLKYQKQKKCENETIFFFSNSSSKKEAREKSIFC